MPAEINYNPDVLTCLANLSSDEVFTPPKLAKDILDQLPTDLWSDPDATFLDPCCKSGVFLREITDRLTKGLAEKIPDLQARINHILTRQVFGLAMTDLTALMSRRSVYCSKHANGKYSICTAFDDPDGHVRFDTIEHTWSDGRCVHCGASQANYQRDEGLESHAYPFIHTDKPEELFNMKFDVIVGNPPYQLNDGGGSHGSGASPIYQHFVEQAKKLNPRYLTMVIPSRWFTGGRGLDSFRSEMLNDDRLRVIHDFVNAGDCFPGIQLKGGACYFLWVRDERGLCRVHTHEGAQVTSVAERPLIEAEAGTFIRYNEAVSILHKVRQHGGGTFASLVSANDPFGFDERVENSYKRIKPQIENVPFDGSINIYYHGWERAGVGFISRDKINRNLAWVDSYKVYISQAYGAGETFPHQILNKPFLGQPGSCCTETYLVIGPFRKRSEAENAISYISTKLFRFLVLLIKNTQHGVKKVYSLVPLVNLSQPWTDAQLYKRYDLTAEEIAFIESKIRPME